MTDRKTPIHLWIIGGVTLLWNAMGAMDYVMAKLEVATYIEMWSASEQAYFTSFPLWANLGWALGVWGAVAGSILLLMRSRLAVMAFALSLFGMAANTIYGFGLAQTPMYKITGPIGLGFTAVIVIVGVALFVYSRKMRAAGVLR